MGNQITAKPCHLFLNLAFAAIVLSGCFINNASAMVLTPPAAIKPNTHNRVTLPKIKFANNIPEHKKPLLTDWVIHANQALRLVYGALPVENFLTVIEASNQGTSAVPWGEVNRSSPPTVTLVVNLNTSLDALKADWTIYHEFSHLLIPYDAADARWFSEGLASYYQNITQARMGMFDEQTLWQKLYEGFERGNKQQNYAHQKLAYVSDHISQNHNYMRIYWSGALYWLKADIALRALSKNAAKPYSLDLALKALQACCFNQYLSATDITQKLDELSQSEIFSRLLTDFSDSYAIPDYLTLLSSLGVEVINGDIKLNNRAKLSLQRKAIFTGMALLPK
ncbi:hypothetical protein H4J51_06090 [Colwellia sp. MB02u-18]|uniref:M61 family metallopeptidase n=1 Tax=unclassified Colwellia TaxID=196834 RepID=UPI0015F49823|nr:MULTISPECIES: hypothetical protein [unclassified Colwellia]MBA6224068.1 hypothetical protein [Colwellia sp. MB3u-45]MBA6269040.1 hypothetical protein [Colwellia sp. MB3u-43]MBA6320874.1 hypothetical protein [Colwellia sp. MB02u-19]MBA6324154.1 hypothetical protein [Colwellia sp. MB02u-18]MBA6332703.1 hypothetical protein [Colwellia sp. MB02u-12]